MSERSDHLVRSRVFGIFLLLWLNTLSYSLDPKKDLSQYVHEVWTTDSGLPSNTISWIVQSRDGSLWIGTSAGLARFDGVRFTVFDSSNTSAFKENEIRALIEDTQGNLWIGTRAGIIRMKDGIFTNFGEKEGLPGPVIQWIYEDPDRAIWIATSGGVARFRNDKFSVYSVKDGLVSNEIYCINADRSGNMWVGTRNGLHKNSNGRFQNILPRDPEEDFTSGCLWEDRDGVQWIFTSHEILKRTEGTLKVESKEKGLSWFREDRDGNIWITSATGLSRLSPGVKDFSKRDQFLNDVVRSIFEDREGSLWIGTGSAGLHRLRDGKFLIYTEKQGLSSPGIAAVYEDSKGDLWVATRDGKLNVFRNGSFQTLRSEGTTKDYVKSLYPSKDGGFWLGTNDSQLIRYYKNRLTTVLKLPDSHVIYALFEDPNNILWMMTAFGTRSYSDSKVSERITDHPLMTNFRCTLTARDGSVWVGTYDFGLKHFKDGKITSYTTKEGLTGNLIWALYEDHEGTIWIGVYDHGLNRLKDGKITSFTVQDGLFTNDIISIFNDTIGNLWLTSHKGIFRISKNELDQFARGNIRRIHPTVYGKDDGLLSAECTSGSQPAAWKTKDGKIWVGTTNGLVRIDPENIKLNRTAPSVIVQGVSVDGSYVSNSLGANNPLSFPPGKDKFEFHYTANSFIAPGKVKFKYMLEGYDKDWTDPGSRRIAYYTSLPPGNYQFRVIAANSDGVWNLQGSAVRFSLQPHFYQTYWFYGLCLAAAGFLIAGAYKLRIRQLNNRQTQLVNLVEERTKSLLEEKKKTEEQAKKLMELDAIKTQFFANISHEFRTPLTLTMGPLENALSGSYGPVNGEMRSQLEMMLRNSRRLLRLINQLLDISKLDAGKMRLKLRNEDLIEFLRRVIATFSSLAERKNIDLQLDSQQNRIEFAFDTEILEQVLFNLLSNAFKFTPPGGKIRISARETEGFSEVKVKDTGAGIPRQELLNVFDRFHQVDGSMTRSHEGSGIGLSLVKDLLRLHGGEIQVESELGFGTEFTFRLPKNLIPQARVDVTQDSTLSQRAAIALAGLDPAITEASEIHSSSENDPSSNSAILLVEDNPEVRRFLRGCLESEYKVLEANDGVEGLQSASSQKPDLIISDIMMPRMDGYELLQSIKSDPSLNHIPVVLLTSKASEDMKVEGLQAGADDYIPKPFNAKELRARTANLLKIRRQEKELKRFNEELERRVQEQLETILKSKRLNKYISKNLVERIFALDNDVQITNERRNITVFFSDLAGFTELSDILEPERTANLLNQYLTEMVRLIESHAGTLARFMGDGIMGFFGAHGEMDVQKQAFNAVSMAVAMQNRFKELAQKWLQEGLDHHLGLRIGIAQDYATVGNFGSEDLMEYTALGNAVNLASRLENACAPGRILVNFVVYSLTSESFAYQQPQQMEIRGFARSMRICELDPALHPQGGPLRPPDSSSQN